MKKVHNHFHIESKHSKKSKFFLPKPQSTAQQNAQYTNKPIVPPMISPPRHPSIHPRNHVVKTRGARPKQKSMTFKRRIFFFMVLMCVFSLFVSLFVDVVILEHVSPDLAGPCVNHFESVNHNDIFETNRLVCLTYQMDKHTLAHRIAQKNR